MQINKDTKICISLASQPSNFGTTLHNLLYKQFNLNFIYKACHTNDIQGAINGIRALNIRGCSISMPFKEIVIDYLDEIDPIAEEVGAVNTIVNQNGYLIGYNTDVGGALLAISNINISQNENILLKGAGGVSKAILLALKKLNFKNIYVINRSREKLINLKKKFDFINVDTRFDPNQRYEILINASPIGMTGTTRTMPFKLETLKKSRAVMDVVVSPLMTHFCKKADEFKKLYVSGYIMSAEQARLQFYYYTGKKIDFNFINKTINEIFT